MESLTFKTILSLHLDKDILSFRKIERIDIAIVGG
jgi:hypothetical protein